MKIQLTPKTPEPVGRDRALAHAQLTIRRDWAASISGFAGWHQLEVEPTPLILHDLNGAELFFDFSLRRGNDAIGFVRTSASKTLGSPVVAVETGPRRWDARKATSEAIKKVKKQFPKADVTSSNLVCYSYPKVGVRVDVVIEQDVRSVIYDVGNLEEITTFGADQPEGCAAWSFYQTIAQPRADEKVKRWELADRELEEAQRRTQNVFATAFTERDADALRNSLLLESPYTFISMYSSRVLKYGPRCSPHDCFMLYSQQTSVYCAVATGQMILDFHRWPYTQDEIADAMNTGASGTTNPNQVAGYESLTNNALDATFDGSADWAEAKAEIDANRPLKSGIPGHARACAGWKRQNLSLIDQPPRRWLQIYDPWPWNADLCQGGAVSWEDWEAVNHTNFIYVRHS